MANLRQCGVFTSLLLISLLSLHDAVRLDLTELRNKVAKIKVNPRGSLWATGHFMGKKSLMDEPAVPLKQKTKLVDPLEDDLPEEERSAFLQQLRVALRARLDTQDCRSSIQVRDYKILHLKTNKQTNKKTLK
uniref:Neuromedin B n=1 Tax=Cynoglossus semilaevis TaxID=244447 RepID=A0A3P8VXS2_CYNSE